MNFEASEDLRAFMSAVERLATHRAIGLSGPAARFRYGSDLAQELEASGFLDCMSVEELGSLAAASMIIELSRLPECVEVVAASLVAPQLPLQVPRPLALLWDDRRRPARFLPMARAVIAVRGEIVEFAELRDGDAVEIVSSFAYPMGVLREPDALEWQVLDRPDASALRTHWRIGIASELVGCLGAGLDAVVDYVKERRQFGRPLGSFQAIQHRLAECATLIEGARWLTLKAADTASPIDVAVAIGHAQQATAKVCHDLHQFMGAMGLTLEHPLHRWTYRARLLRAELGGAEHHFSIAADAAWGSPAGAHAR